MTAEAPPALFTRIALARPGFHLHAHMLLRRPGVAALYGPSGCGKSTFLRCLAGLEPACEGKVQVGAHCWQDSRRAVWTPPHRRRVGLVFQDARLFEHLRVKDNLLFGARLRKHPPKPEAFQELVALLDLEHLLHRHPATLSGGERQRVAIGRALFSAPRLLLLDEPLSAVDADRKSEILPHLERLFAQIRIPVVLVSHDWQDVLRLSSRVYLMEAGQIRRHGATLALQYRLGDYRLNALEARVHGWNPEERLLSLWIGEDLVRVPAQHPPEARRMRLLVNPLEVAVSRRPVTHSSILNVLRCHLTALQPLSEGRMGLDLAGAGWKLQAVITQASARRLELTPGVELYALIKSVLVDHADL